MDRLVNVKLANNPIVANIIAEGLTNRRDTHKPAESITTWHDGTQSSIVYVPRLSAHEIRLIIVEFGSTLDKEYVVGLSDGACQQAFKRFGIKPVLLIICMEKIDKSLDTHRNRHDAPCGIATVSSKWASGIYVIDKESAKRHMAFVDEDDDRGESRYIRELDPFIIYALFVQNLADGQIEESMTIDHTLRILAGIAIDARNNLKK